MRRRRANASRGQALVEFALILPLFITVLLGVIVLGIAVFYNQQLTNAAREAARYASVHSATALRPTVPDLDPGSVDSKAGDPLFGYTSAALAPQKYLRWDVPSAGWPLMTAFARTKVFGLNASGVLFSACWSGFVDDEHLNYDARPAGSYVINGNPVVINSDFRQCQIGGEYPTVNPGGIPCDAGTLTTDRTDTASSASSGGAEARVVANRVTVFACYQWSPPGAGFLLIPQTITFRAVISEPIQRQQ